MPSSRSFLAVVFALSFASLPGCGDELAADDFTDPPVPEDAEIPEDADVPLLPPNTGYEDDAAADDATVDDAADDATADDAGTDDATADDAGTDDATIDATATDAGSRDASARDATATDARARDASVADVVARPTPRCTGSASGQSAIWTCTADRARRQRCVSGSVQTEACAHGCVAQPSGTNDYCAPTPPPSPTLPACAHRALLHAGLHPDASDRLRCAGVPDARIVQTIGYATASAGTHAPDGRANGLPYAAATDISVRGLSSADIRALLSRLADQGFAGWYRWPGHDGWPSSESPHMHVVYVGCAMKSSLDAQVRDWLAGRNGLASHTAYGFYTWSSAQRALVRAVYDRFN